MNRGGLNILGLREVYNQGDRDALDPAQINALRVIYGSGIKVWGSSTMQTKASALSEISVRRLMIMLEQSIARAALYSVFEQNDLYLRARLADLASSFLEPIKRGNGIYDYAVICDDYNNPPEVVANGDTVLDVYIDPALPVKRIHLNAIIAKTGGISFALSQTH
jgi:phage tail sheath protein FI